MADERFFKIGSLSCGTSGCCGIDELHGFVEALGSKSDKPVTDAEWRTALVDAIENESLNMYSLGPIVLFSGNEDQEKCKFSPHAMASWLLEQGENVVLTPRVRNTNSGSMIQAFLWTPSRRFKNKLTATQKKNNKESDDETRANVA